MKLAHKLFAALTLTSLATVVLMVAITHWYASRHFRAYLKKAETEKLDELAVRLSREHDPQTGWQRVENDESLWRRLLHDLAPRGEHFPPPLPGEHPPGAGDREPPPPAAGVPPPFPPGPPRDPLRIAPRVSLFDARKRPVLGRAGSADRHVLKPVTVDNETVGWVGIEEGEGPRRPMDAQFLRRQARAFLLIGGGILLAAGIVSYGLSRHLLAPVRRLAQGTRALRERRFETRVEAPSEDELGRLARDFNDMARELERYEAMRRQWISDVAHELRTPLAVLRGEMEAVLDGVRPFNQENLTSLHNEVMHLGRIVNDLHELSMAESGALSFRSRPVDPLEILEGALEGFRNRFRERKIVVRDPPEHAKKVSMVGDPCRLKQLFSNLLENGLRYMDAPGVLDIETVVHSGSLTIAFEDSGPGVPEESLGRLFQRLYRVDASRSRSKGGSGLGLAICKTIVEMHGGTIQALAGSRGGLRVEVFLPLKA